MNDADTIFRISDMKSKSIFNQWRLYLTLNVFLGPLFLRRRQGETDDRAAWLRIQIGCTWYPTRKSEGELETMNSVKTKIVLWPNSFKTTWPTFFFCPPYITVHIRWDSFESLKTTEIQETYCPGEHWVCGVNTGNTIQKSRWCMFNIKYLLSIRSDQMYSVLQIFPFTISGKKTRNQTWLS